MTELARQCIEYMIQFTKMPNAESGSMPVLHLIFCNSLFVICLMFHIQTQTGFKRFEKISSETSLSYFDPRPVHLMVNTLFDIRVGNAVDYR